MKKIYILLLICAAGTGYSQQGFGTSNPAPSSVIDMVASNKGALLPRVTLTSTAVAAPVPSPANALTVFNTATTGDVTPGYYYWSTTDTKWVRLLTENIQDLRLLAGTNNHLTQDAGVGSNGTSLGTGTNNVAIGLGALGSNIDGNKNIGIGTNALFRLKSGNGNIILGENFGDFESGNNNVVIGNNSGAYMIHGDNDVLLGYGARALINATGIFPNNALSNSVNIGNAIYASTDAMFNDGSSGSKYGRTVVGNFYYTSDADNVFKETFNVGSGGIWIRDINSTDYTGNVATDKVVVADANGVLKTVDATNLTVEPWQVESTSTKATTNTQNIYQNANIGIGDFTTENPIAKLDVRGAVRVGTPHSDELSGASAIGTNSATFGTNNKATGINSFAAGIGNEVTGNDASIALGYYVQASGSISIATGYLTTASGFDSTAMGAETIASAPISTAMGSQTIASGNASTAMGQNTTASGTASTAMGQNTTVSGTASTAMGQSTTANGTASTAMGQSTTANGTASTAMGQNNTAFGSNSTAMGYNNKASSAFETVMGTYSAIATGNFSINVATDALLQVGNGNSATSSNALTILKNAHTAIGIIGTEATAKPTELLDLGGTATATNGGLRIRNINSAAYTGSATDKIVTVDATGVLKTVAAINTTAIIKITAAYTVLAADYTILANATSAGFTVTLPAASALTGRVLIIRKSDETTNVVTFSAPIKISETTSFTTVNVNSTIRIQSDGTDWYQID